MSGIVLVDEQRVDKPGLRLDPSSGIRLKSEPRKYVSRGGLKLEAALRRLQIQVQDKVCLDLGASTGGFTDCLLQHAALRVYAFDVGRGQLHWKLQLDPRVIFRDAVNVRYLETSMVDDQVDLVTVDLSFISLRLIFPSLKPFSAEILALVKPQFEAQRGEVGLGGVIESPALRERIVDRVKRSARREGFSLLGECPSPIVGQKGNQEHFLLLR